MKPAILLFITAITFSKSFSQKNQFEGYFINTTGDTIYGKFPEFKEKERNPNEMKFITVDNKKITLNPQNCILFQVKDYDTYEAYHGQRMINPIEDTKSEMTNSPDTYDTLHTFLRIIYKANDITVYSYKDKKRENFFYRMRDKKITELEKKLYVYYAGESRQATSINKFRDQLKEEFSRQIQQKQLEGILNNLAYTEKNITRFMDLLNETSVSKQNNKYPAKFFIGAGATFNSMNITGDKSHLEEQVDHKSPVSPVLLIGAKFYTKRNRGRILISPRVRIFSFSGKGDIDLTSGTATYNHKSEFWSKLIINPSALIGYNIINNPGLKWHTSAGIGYAFLINSKEIQTTTYTVPPPTIIERENPRPMVFVFNIETGVDIGKNIGIWLNYQPPAETSAKYSNKSLKFSSFQAGISWSFQVKK